MWLKGIEAAHLEMAQMVRNNNALMTNGILNIVIAIGTRHCCRLCFCNRLKSIVRS